MSSRAEMVVLVHGLWMHGVTMKLLERWIARQGYTVVCYSYRSVRLALTENADQLAEYAQTLNAEPIHWVGHSLGGIVVLRMFARHPQLPAGRAVLLGPPYHDTYAGRSLSRYDFGRRAVGRSVDEWLHSEKAVEYSGREIGIVAGSLSVGMGRIVARGLPVPNDGAVTVDETRLACASDHIVIPINHFGMLISRKVAQQTAAFLRQGRFEHGAHA